MFKDNFVNLSENKQLDYAKSYAAAAKTLLIINIRVYFLNLFHLFKDSPEVLVLGDGIHPNELGHAVISKEIIRLLNSEQRRKPSLSFGTITAAASNDISVTVLNAE
jgi:lysophospholipase L1-like esterase